MSKASDAASVAADAIAWAIMGRPSDVHSLTLSQKATLARRASNILEYYQNDAESDPNTFAQDLFVSLKDIMVEYASDIADAEEINRL